MTRIVKDASTCRQPMNHRAAYWITGILIFSTAAVYTPVFWQEFINFDDPGYVTDNPHVQHGLNVQSIRWAFTSSKESNWHPLTWISLMADYQMFDGKAWGFKLVNLMLHIANTVLLFWVMRKMTGGLWSSAFIAVLFALHPLHVESVAWVAERKDVLSSLFWMLTMLAYISYARRPSAGRYMMVMVGLGVGLLAKPMLVTLPCVLLLLDMWPLNRAAAKPLNADKDNVFSRRSFAALVIEKIPLSMLVLASCVVTFIVQQRSGSVASLELQSLAIRLQNAAISYVSYLWKMILPIRLAAFYSHPDESVSGLKAIVCTLGLILISIIVLQQRRKRPFLAVGWFWYVGTLVPVIGLVQVGSQAMADRYTYIPLIGIFMIITEWFRDQVHQGRLSRRMVASAAVVVLVILSGLTVRQVGFWKDSFTLHSHAIDVTDDKYFSYCNLAAAYERHNDNDQAITYFEKAYALRPEQPDIHDKLGIAYSLSGQYQKALDHYKQALLYLPDNADIYRKMGLCLAQLGQYDEAISAFEHSLRQNPESPDVHNELGLCLAKNNHLDEAMEHFRLGIASDKDKNNPKLYINLGHAWLMKKEYDKAIPYFEQTLTIDPDSYLGHLNLNQALILAGRPDEAIRRAQEYAQSRPNDPNAQYIQGAVQAQVGQRDAAVGTFQKVLRLCPSHADAKRELGRLLQKNNSQP